MGKKRFFCNIAIIMIAIGLAGCATLTQLTQVKTEKERKQWGEVLQEEVLQVKEVYSLGDLPRTRVLVKGKELIFE